MSGAILSQLTSSNVLGVIIAYIACSLFVSSWRSPRYPKSLPRVGQGKGWLAGLKQMKSWSEEGYETYNKKGQACLLPGVLGSPPEVVIPRSQMGWMLDLPDNKLSSAAAHYDSLQGEYNFLSKDILNDPFHEHVIHRFIARNLQQLLPGSQEEIKKSLDEVLGMDEKEWKTVNLYQVLLSFIPKVTNRMLIGKPVCENEDYVSNMAKIMMDVVGNSFILSLVPNFLRFIVGPIVALTVRYHFWRTSRYSLPVIKQLLKDFERKESGDPAYKDWTPPNTFISWSIQLAKAEGRRDELQPMRLAQRLIPLNFAAIHTTALTSHSTWLDLLAMDEKDSVIESLREEAERLWVEENGQWTKNGLSRMFRIDSALRESMRFSSIAQTLIHRKVVAREGIVNPETGWKFDYGTILSCPLWGNQHDDDLVGGEANRYDPLRYSREREEYEALSKEDRDVAEGLQLKNKGMVTTSKEHLAFGHGRHACPGRFFAAYGLKMFFAYVLINYDVKRLDKRPESKWVGRNIIPPTGATIQVRRRAA